MSNSLIYTSTISLALGVLLRSFIPLSWPVFVFVFLIGCVALVFYFNDKRPAYTLIAVMCFACALGMFRMDAAKIVPDPELALLRGQVVSVLGRVSAEPDVRENGTRLYVDAYTLEDDSGDVSLTARVLALAPPHTEVSFGDTVRVEGILRLPESFDSSTGRTFNYPMFLAKDGVVYEIAFAQVERLGTEGGNVLKRAALGLKSLYLQGLRSTLPEPAAGLAGGITVGDKRSIGGELSEVFQKVSLVHIIVLSGYNMTVVTNAAGQMFSFLPRHVKFGVSGSIVALFILMTGGAASAVRAGAMSLIATYARLSGREYLALRVLFIVAAGMIMWNPYVLAFDPGFQLSILATLGLVLFTEPISRHLLFVPERFALREIAASTLATQIVVLPLLLYQNGTLSLVSLPANLFTLVVVPVAMLASLLSALAGIFLGPFGVIFALPALALLEYMIIVARTFASVPFATVTIPAFDWFFMMLAYVGIFGMALYVQKRERRAQSPADYT